MGLHCLGRRLLLALHLIGSQRIKVVINAGAAAWCAARGIDPACLLGLGVSAMDLLAGHVQLRIRMHFRRCATHRSRCCCHRGLPRCVLQATAQQR